MRKRLSAVVILSGLLCIVSALSLTAYNLHTESSAGETAREAMVSVAESVTKPEDVRVVPLYQIEPKIDMPELEVNGVRYIGYLRLPTLGLELPVITKTTNALLQVAPCRLSGSAYLENLVIGAHNYATHFGNLKKLHYGDPIEFVDMDGNVFCYEVGEIEILQPDQLEYLCSGDYPLSLYTCTIGGRTRLTVRCLAIE